MILVTCVVTADAFQSIALRSLHSQKGRVIGLAPQRDILRQRKSMPTFVNRLRAVATLDSEQAYHIAQA